MGHVETEGVVFVFFTFHLQLLHTLRFHQGLLVVHQGLLILEYNSQSLLQGFVAQFQIDLIDCARQAFLFAFGHGIQVAFHAGAHIVQRILAGTHGFRGTTLDGVGWVFGCQAIKGGRLGWCFQQDGHHIVQRLFHMAHLECQKSHFVAHLVTRQTKLVCFVVNTVHCKLRLGLHGIQKPEPFRKLLRGLHLAGDVFFGFRDLGLGGMLRFAVRHEGIFLFSTKNEGGKKNKVVLGGGFQGRKVERENGSVEKKGNFGVEKKILNPVHLWFFFVSSLTECIMDPIGLSDCDGCKKRVQTSVCGCILCKTGNYCTPECCRAAWPVHRLSCPQHCFCGMDNTKRIFFLRDRLMDNRYDDITSMCCPKCINEKIDGEPLFFLMVHDLEMKPNYWQAFLQAGADMCTRVLGYTLFEHALETTTRGSVWLLTSHDLHNPRNALIFFLRHFPDVIFESNFNTPLASTLSRAFLVEPVRVFQEAGRGLLKPWFPTVLVELVASYVWRMPNVVQACNRFGFHQNEDELPRMQRSPI
jgi:hypothetical protein